MKLNKNSSIVILTGAGISAESGIKTFRDHNGLWENHDVQEVASIAGFRKNPELVQKFYNQRRAQLLLPAIAPNAAHHALAKLEAAWSGRFLLVTQNVDDLHDRAGSKKLIHMHGELLKVKCEHTSEVFAWREDISHDSPCPCCKMTGRLRPDIVWFGEMPYQMEEIYLSLETADIFIAIGTSGQVYPASGFVAQVKESALTIEMNKEDSAISECFKEHLIGPASEVVVEWVDFLIKKYL